METFALAAISLTIATSLLIKKKIDPLHRSYGLLCLVLACERGGYFLLSVTGGEFWGIVHVLGVAILAPLLVFFSRHFIGDQEPMVSGKVTWYVFAGACGAGFLYLLFRETHALAPLGLYGYTTLALAWCFVALVRTALGAEGVRKKRLGYVVIAVVAWGLMSLSDILRVAGFPLPSLSEIAGAGLVYFILIIIVYPRLPELHEIMARAVIIFILIFFVTALFYIIGFIFGTSEPLPAFNLVFMASFIVVIFIDPVKLLLKRAVSLFLFDGRVAFTSLFALEDEVEKEKSLFLEEMSRGLAHEIRNPLGSIKGAAQYLKTGTDPAEAQQLLDVITEETDRLGNVVSRFLSYANPYVVDAKPRDMNALVERTLDLIKRDDFPDGIVVTTDLAPDLPPVPLDEEQFMQVIFNIVLNALEAMPDGGTLTIASAPHEGEGVRAVELTIRDTGPGIARDDMKKLFKPFFTTKKGGTGLGLAICRKIISEHGGYIGVSSQAGKGAEFNIILPVN